MYDCVLRTHSHQVNGQFMATLRYNTKQGKRQVSVSECVTEMLRANCLWLVGRVSEGWEGGGGVVGTENISAVN